MPQESLVSREGQIRFEQRQCSDIKSLSPGEWDLIEQVQDYEKTLRPALPHCTDKASKNWEWGFPLPFPTPGRTSAVRTGHGEAPESEVTRQAMKVPFCLRTALCSLTGELVNESSQRPGEELAPPCPVLSLPACSGSECSSRSGGSRGSTRCSRPGG